MLKRIDNLIIHTSKKIATPMARVVIFIIFSWFGILKPLGISPADPLVASLLEQTLPFISFSTFSFYFGIFEVFIGVSFLIPGFEREAIGLLLVHMLTTLAPLFLLPRMVWQQSLVPTLEGQYILKNLAFITLAIVVAAHVKKEKGRD
ncbi:MAG: hypothetical protein ABEJ02_00925 [Candidatus Paceibacteria bacterium]